VSRRWSRARPAHRAHTFDFSDEMPRTRAHDDCTRSSRARLDICAHNPLEEVIE
jgi:hypothetical protein